MLLADITMPEFVAGLERTRTVLLPVGATEEHGPHLPLATDTLMAETVCRKLAEERPLFVAPALSYGVCRSTGQHPGTLSISTATLKMLALDIVTALYRQGLRNVVILSGHAGGTHNAALIDAGEELLECHPELNLAVVTEYDLVNETAHKLVATPNDSHAGEIETSRMLHSHPHLVQGSAAAEFPSFPRGILVRDKLKYWPGGVWGDPGAASREKGAAIERLVLTGLGALLDQLESL